MASSLTPLASAGPAAFLPQDAAFALVAGPGAVPTLEVAVDGRLVAVFDESVLVRAPSIAVNRLRSDDGDPFWSRWLVEMDGGEAGCSANILPEWTLDEVGTAYLFSSKSDDEAELTATYSCPVQGRWLAAAPGESYRFSGLFGLHRCSGRVRMIFADAQGELERIEADISSGAVGGRRLEDYATVVLGGRAPANASLIRLEVVKDVTATGGDSFLFFTQLHLCRAELDEAPAREIAPPVVLNIALFAGAGRSMLLAPLGFGEEWDFQTSSHVELFERNSGDRLAEGRLTPDASPFAASMLGLDGSVLIARVSRVAVWLEGVSLSLWVDGVRLGEREFSLPSVGDLLRFPLPVALLDAQPHLFELKLTRNGRRVASFAALAPDLAGSPSRLAGQRSLPAFFARTPAAEQRYQALSAALRRFVGGEATEEALATLRSVALAHETLEGGFAVPRRTYAELDFERPPMPRVSVIIPVHNSFAVTYNCLSALRLAGANASFEVVVVDDGSDDLTRRLPEIAPGIVYVRNEQPLGFVGACNRGAEAARGAFFVFLNNDTEPTVGWMDELLFAFEQFDRVGLAGSKLVYPDGRLQDAGGIVWSSGDPWNYGRGGNPREPRFCYTRQVDYLSGAALMIDSAVWREVGGFSAEFAPAYFEDTDLAFKVRAAGKQTVFVPHSLVYHYEGLSNGTDVAASSGLKRFQEINRPKFKRKWLHACADNGVLGQDVDLAKDRQVEGRVVFFDLDAPKPDENAGGYASLQEIRLFQSLGFKVTFAPLSMNYPGKNIDHMQRLGVEVVYSPYYADVDEFISRRGAEFDLAYVTRYQTAARITDAFRRVSKAPVMCNVADLHFVRAMRKAATDGDRWEELASAERLREAELAALAKVDVALSYSDVETDLMASLLPGHVKVGRLPWVVEPSSKVAPLEGRRGVAFLGGFIHAPNIAAAEFFAAAVMPLLRQRIPGCAFHVYGSNIPAPVADALTAEGAVVEGFVPDLAAVFDNCRVFVCPLTYGAGVKGKVLDCLAAGIPSVLSSVAAEGLPIKHGREAVIADTPAEWAEAVATLYTDDALWRAMSAAALALAARRFSFERARATMADILAMADLKPRMSRPQGLFATRSRPTPPGRP